MSPVHTGIDVSHHNGSIDWRQVANAGVEFVYIKATQGSTFVDPMFASHLGGAEGAGLLHGAYHYLTPGDQAEDQADLFLSTLADKVGQLPPAVDIEPTFAEEGGPDLWGEIPLEERIEKILKFCGAVQSATGVVPILYMSPSYVGDMLGADPRLAAYGLWVAEYGVEAPRVPTPFTGYRCWQRSEFGVVPGAGGGVDIDVWNGDVGS